MISAIRGHERNEAGCAHADEKIKVLQAENQQKRLIIDDLRRQLVAVWTSTLLDVAAVLCPGCNQAHVLENGRLWAFCGLSKLVETPAGINETALVAFIKANMKS